MKFKMSLLLLFIFYGAIYSWPKKMIITVPVADLRNERSDVTDFSHTKYDTAQLTQLIFGENVIAYEEVDGYLKVSAVDQEVYDFGKSEFIECPGWIRSEQALEVEDFFNHNLIVKEPSAIIWDDEKSEEIIKIYLGTELSGAIGDGGFFDVIFPAGKGRIKNNQVLYLDDFNLDEESLRLEICNVAKLFLSNPYTWGGRSIHDELLESKGQLTGVDCSNLVSLSYKVCGMKIPRNSFSQHKKSRSINSGKELKPADLVFTAQWKLSALGYKVGHVMIYLGDDCFIESIGGKIRKVMLTTGKDRFGKSVVELNNDDKTNLGKVYFGTFF